MPSIKFPQLVALAELLESEDVFLSLGTLESLLEQCQEQLKLRAKEFAPAWSTNLEWNLEQLETTFRIYLLEKAGNGQFRTCAIAFSKNLRLALFQPDEFMELKGPEAKDHRNQLMATLRERSRKWPQPPKYIKLVSLPADASENNPSSVTNFLQQLIDAPDVVELTEPGMALLEAHLKRPRTLKQMRQEALAADGSNKTTGRQKLKLIRDYNRRLPRRAEASEPAQNWNICQGYLDPLANALAAIAHRFTKHFDVARHDELEREYESIVGASAHFSEHLTDDQRQRLDTVVQELAAINEPPTAQQVESLYKKYQIELAADWLKVNVSVEYANDFGQQLEAARKRLAALEFKASQIINGDEAKSETIFVRYAIQRLLVRHNDLLHERFPDHEQQPERDELPADLRRFEIEVVDEYTEIQKQFGELATYLRRTAKLIPSQRPRDVAGGKLPPMSETANGEIAKLHKKVVALEKHNKARLTPQAKRRQVRIKFIRARVGKKVWQEIVTDWRAKPPHEWKAENLADAMRLFWGRHGDK